MSFGHLEFSENRWKKAAVNAQRKVKIMCNEKILILDNISIYLSKKSNSIVSLIYFIIKWEKLITPWMGGSSIGSKQIGHSPMASMTNASISLASICKKYHRKSKHLNLKQLYLSTPQQGLKRCHCNQRGVTRVDVERKGSLPSLALGSACYINSISKE